MVKTAARWFALTSSVAISVLPGIAISAPAYAETQFRVRLVSDPTSLDWNLAHTDAETPIMMNIMEGLVEFDRDMKVKPLLAESWTISPDQKTYTFKLRSDIKWSDGKTLIADHFVYSWKRLLAPLTAAPYAYIFFDIEGAEEFNSRKITDFANVGIKALDQHTIQVKLKKPVAYFIQMFTFWVTFPVREDVVEKHGVNWAQPGKTVVLGPFIPVNYQVQSQITLKRNELYHGKKPAVDTVVLRIINEDSTALNLFRAKQLDYVRPVNFLEMSDLKGTPAFHTTTYFRTCFVGMNLAKYPFNLPKVRQALAMAIDRSKLPSTLHRDIKPANSLMPEALWAHGAGAALPYDVAAAKKLLTEAVGDPTNLPAIEFYTFASDETALLAQYIQDQLKKNLGLKIQIQMPEYSSYRSAMKLGTSPLYYRCWAADYADPDTFFGVFTSASGNNMTGFKNARYDELVRKAASTSQSPERNKLYREALDLLLRAESPIAPLYYDTLTFLLNPAAKNFVINPLNYTFFKDITFK